MVGPVNQLLAEKWDTKSFHSILRFLSECPTTFLIKRRSSYTSDAKHPSLLVFTISPDAQTQKSLLRENDQNS
jgi:hypothetical protein